jgi:hypothetical protein
MSTDVKYWRTVAFGWAKERARVKPEGLFTVIGDIGLDSNAFQFFGVD